VARSSVIVVGLGAMGSAVCRELAARGITVAGIDRHHPPHVLGSSHGDTRITRLATSEGPQYFALARRSQERWRALEAETGESLLNQVGTLMISTGGSLFMNTVRSVAEQFSIEHELLDAVTVRERFPMFAVGDGAVAYLEPEGGYVRPEATVAAQLALASRDGATLRLGETVTGWTASADGIAVTLDGGETITGGQLVLCAGPWLPQLLGEELGASFSIHRQISYWFEIETGHDRLSRMPSWIYDLAASEDRPGAAHQRAFYGFPALDGPGGGLKLGMEQYEVHHLPDDRQHPASAEQAAALHREILRDRLPWVRPRAVRSVSCLYTCTPDSHFVIDRHPGHDMVTLVSPCSGHGFKHSAAIGEAVAQTIAGEPLAPGVDLAPFALSRLLGLPEREAADETHSDHISHR
jgi:sarcosine oxidase